MHRRGSPSEVPPQKFWSLINARLVPEGVVSRPGLVTDFDTGTAAPIDALFVPPDEDVGDEALRGIVVGWAPSLGISGGLDPDTDPGDILLDRIYLYDQTVPEIPPAVDPPERLAQVNWNPEIQQTNGIYGLIWMGEHHPILAASAGWLDSGTGKWRPSTEGDVGTTDIPAWECSWQRNSDILHCGNTFNFRGVITAIAPNYFALVPPKPGETPPGAAFELGLGLYSVQWPPTIAKKGSGTWRRIGGASINPKGLLDVIVRRTGVDADKLNEILTIVVKQANNSVVVYSFDGTTLSPELTIAADCKGAALVRLNDCGAFLIAAYREPDTDPTVAYYQSEPGAAWTAVTLPNADLVPFGILGANNTLYLHAGRTSLIMQSPPPAPGNYAGLQGLLYKWKPGDVAFTLIRNFWTAGGGEHRMVPANSLILGSPWFDPFRFYGGKLWFVTTEEFGGSPRIDSYDGTTYVATAISLPTAYVPAPIKSQFDDLFIFISTAKDPDGDPIFGTPYGDTFYHRRLWSYRPEGQTWELLWEDLSDGSKPGFLCAFVPNIQEEQATELLAGFDHP
jgi:hypothetical protein